MANHVHRCSAVVRHGHAIDASCWRAATVVVDGRGYCTRHHPDRVAKLKAIEKPKTIAICGGCACGIAYVPEFDSLDSGTTLTDEAGHKHVVTIASPEECAKVYADMAAAHTELAQVKIKAGLALRLLDLLEQQPDNVVGIYRFGSIGDYCVSIYKRGSCTVYRTRDTVLEALEAALDTVQQKQSQ